MSSEKSKPKMGRPPKRPADKQSRAVLSRFTPDEFAALKRDAAGQPLAAYLREFWLQHRRDK
jgi:hypothetical protein